MEDYLLAKIEESQSMAKEHESRFRFYRHAFYRLEKNMNAFLDKKESSERFMILYGLRGIGKTVLLMQIYNKLLKRGVSPNQILYLSLDDLTSYGNASLAMAIDAYVRKIHKKTLPTLDKQIFLLIDEAHFDKDWELALKVPYDKSENVFIIVTGSSAISLDYTADTARRSIKMPLFPLNFSEYEMLKNSVFPPRNMANEIKSVIFGEIANINSINEKEKIFKQYLEQKGLDIKTEVSSFLQTGGFASTLTVSGLLTYKKILSVVDKIVRKDLPATQKMNAGTITDISRIIGYLALKMPGETANNKLARDLKLSPDTVKEILHLLEKSHLISIVKPRVKKAGAYARLPWKYYFISPSILCALRKDLGMETLEGDSKGLIYETAVMSTLARLVETSDKNIAINYDTNRESNVDFLMVNQYSGAVIPVEVGSKKGRSQIREAIERFNSEYGIVVTGGAEKVSYSEKILTVPFFTFILS